MCLLLLHEKNLPRELWAVGLQSACHVINRLPPWPRKASSPFEVLYHRKPNVSYFLFFGSVCYVNVSKNNQTKLDPRASVVFLLVMILTGKDGDVWIHKQRRLRFLVMWCLMNCHLGKLKARLILNLFSENVASSERGSNISSSGENIHEAETSDAVLRRSLRQRKQPDYLGDYEVQMNHSSVLSCFFIKDTCDGEPKSYNEAKRISEWEEAMKE